MNVFGKTDKGLVRSNNQDTYRTELLDNGYAFLILCDGMGGARAGNIASDKTAEGFLDYLKENCKESMDTKEIASVLNDGVRSVNRDVYELANSSPDYQGMGTTLVGGIALDDTIILANVGDSRAYLISQEHIAQVTQDHSLVEEMVRAGRLTKKEARHYPGRNLITRAVGVDESVEPDLYQITLHEGQKLLLCSDGLSGMLTDMEILKIVQGAEDVRSACDELIAQACEAGGSDNITVVLYTK